MIGSEAIAKVTVVKSKTTDYIGNDIATMTPVEELTAA